MSTLTKPIHLAFLILVISALEPQSSPADSTDLWAVIATEAVREAGVSDLLFASLAENDVPLVEREQLGSLLKEIEFAALAGGAEGVDVRRDIQARIQADWLILLSVEEGPQTSRLTLVVCETHQGARLKIEYLPWPADAPDLTAAELTKTLLQLRRQFPDGIKQIIGVGPFLSRNLLHGFDHLQAGFAQLLEQALVREAGVAVIEVAEARAIGAEIDATAGRLEDRIVPLILEGEFQMTDQTKLEPINEARVSLSVSESDSNSREWTLDLASLGEASLWLSRDLPTKIIQRSETRESEFSRQQQFETLCRRADRFALVGAWRESIQLRESALLLQNDLSQQMRLVGEHREYLWIADKLDVNERVAAQNAQKSLEERNEITRRQNRLRNRYSSRLVQLCEQLISSGEINVVEGAHLFQRVFHVRNRPSVPLGDERRLEWFQHRQRLYWDNIRRIAQLDAGIRDGNMHPELRRALKITRTFWSPTRAGQIRYWLAGLPGLIPRFVSDRKFVGQANSPVEFLRDYERLIDECDPWPIVPMVTYSLPRKFSRLNGGELVRLSKIYGVTDAEVQRFYDKLATSENALKQLYGRVGLLAPKLEFHQRKPPEVPAAVRGEFKLLKALALKYGRDNPETAEIAQEVHNHLLHAEVIATRGWYEYTKWRDAPAIAAYRKPEPAPEAERLIDPNPPALRFKSVDGVTATWDRLVACGPGLDAVFRDDELWLMPKPGELISVFKRPQLKDHIQSAVWDGNRLWVTASLSGVRAFDRNGELLAHFAPSGPDAVDQPVVQRVNSEPSLPPYRPEYNSPSSYRTSPVKAYISKICRPPLKICPLGNGQCVVAGRSGELKRLWVSLVGIDDAGRRSAELLHQARRIPVRTDEHWISDPAFTFDPDWMALYEVESPSPRQFVVISRSSFSVDSKKLAPFLLDLRSRKVSVLPRKIAEETQRLGKEVAIEARILKVIRDHIKQQFGTESGQVRVRFMDAPHLGSYSVMPRVLFQWRNDLLLAPSPHSRWTQISLSPFRIARLRRDLSQPQQQYEFFGVSSHFGPVAWNTDGPLMQAIIE